MRKFSFNQIALAAALCSAGLSAQANCLPEGGQIVAGQGGISSAATNMVVKQTSNRMIASFQSFSIGAGCGVQVNQPDARSAALFRVTGRDLSQIDGRLKANGQVWLANPNGIILGRDGAINAASTVLTTGTVNEEDFMQRTSLLVKGMVRITDIRDESLIANDGNIETNAPAGAIILASGQIENHNNIVATTGKTAVSLLSGQEVSVTQSWDERQPLNAVVTQVGQTAQITQSQKGKVDASGGTVTIHAAGLSEAQPGIVNLSGLIFAKQLGASTAVQAVNIQAESINIKNFEMQSNNGISTMDANQVRLSESNLIYTADETQSGAYTSIRGADTLTGIGVGITGDLTTRGVVNFAGSSAQMRGGAVYPASAGLIVNDAKIVAMSTDAVGLSGKAANQYASVGLALTGNNVIVNANINGHSGSEHGRSVVIRDVLQANNVMLKGMATGENAVGVSITNANISASAILAQGGSAFGGLTMAGQATGTGRTAGIQIEIPGLYPGGGNRRQGVSFNAAKNNFIILNGVSDSINSLGGVVIGDSNLFLNGLGDINFYGKTQGHSGVALIASHAIASVSNLNIRGEKTGDDEIGNMHRSGGVSMYGYGAKLTVASNSKVNVIGTGRYHGVLMAPISNLDKVNLTIDGLGHYYSGVNLSGTSISATNYSIINIIGKSTANLSRAVYLGANLSAYNYSRVYVDAQSLNGNNHFQPLVGVVSVMTDRTGIIYLYSRRLDNFGLWVYATSAELQINNINSNSGESRCYLNGVRVCF